MWIHPLDVPVITRSVNGCVYKWMTIPGGRWHVLLCLVVGRRRYEMSSSFCHNTTDRGHMDSWYLCVILFVTLSSYFDVPCSSSCSINLYKCWNILVKKKSCDLVINNVCKSNTCNDISTPKILETCKICFLHSLLHWYRFVCKWGW